jgi:hypothetical protein
MMPDTQLENVSIVLPERQSDLAARVQSAHGRVYFDVPFEQKDTAKAAGLRWDNTLRKWYAENAEIAKAFSLSAEVNADAPTQVERYYFKVPFLQKDLAKRMGMRFDGVRKLWFAPSSVLAVDAARIFERMVEQSDDNSRYSPE